MRVNAEQPESNLIDSAAELLERGELVAFPTETVYGLGANALDPEAVVTAGIYVDRVVHVPYGEPTVT